MLYIYIFFAGYRKSWHWVSYLEIYLTPIITEASMWTVMWRKFFVALYIWDINFLTKHNVLSKSQIGFVPKHCASDHIYTLHNLIDKHVLQIKNKIFACFIDFKKAFDSIWHNGLFYKVIESGIWGKTYDIIN